MDLRAPESVRELLEAVDTDTRIVLAAGRTRRSPDSSGLMLHNLRIAEMAAQLVRMGNCRSLVFLSTTDVYGARPRLPITEDSPVEPDSYYAISKYASEQLLSMTTGNRFTMTVLRLPGVYGPGDGGNSTVGRLTRDIKAGEKIHLLRNGKLLRDYLEVSDLCRAVEAVVREPVQGPINVASGLSTYMKDLVKMIGDALAVTPDVLLRDTDDIKGDHIFGSWFFRMTPIKDGVQNYVAATSDRSE